MLEHHDIVTEILTELHKVGALQEIMMVGSWCLPIYKTYFNDAPEVPLLRTTDIDFMIPYPPRIEVEADIPSILDALGFSEHFDTVDDVIKYLHPDLEIEFLIPEIGKPKSKARYIENLNISAQPLRFLPALFDNSEQSLHKVNETGRSPTII